MLNLHTLTSKQLSLRAGKVAILKSSYYPREGTHFCCWLRLKCTWLVKNLSESSGEVPFKVLKFTFPTSRGLCSLTFPYRTSWGGSQELKLKIHFSIEATDNVANVAPAVQRTKGPGWPGHFLAQGCFPLMYGKMTSDKDVSFHRGRWCNVPPRAH